MFHTHTHVLLVTYSFRKTLEEQEKGKTLGTINTYMQQVIRLSHNAYNDTGLFLKHGVEIYESLRV